MENDQSVVLLKYAKKIYVMSLSTSRKEVSSTRFFLICCNKCLDIKKI